MYRVFIYAITVVIKSAFATGILFFSQEQCTETRPLFRKCTKSDSIYKSQIIDH